MTRRVRANADFDRDLAGQIDFLIREERPSWVDLLLGDIRELETMLGEFPGAGHVVEANAGREVRRIQLRHVPFRAWYRIEPADPSAPVDLLRLLHVRQRSDRPPV